MVDFSYPYKKCEIEEFSCLEQLYLDFIKTSNEKSKEKIIKMFLPYIYVYLKNDSFFVFSEDDYQEIIVNFIIHLNYEYKINTEKCLIRTAIINWIKGSKKRVIDYKYAKKRTVKKKEYADMSINIEDIICFDKINLNIQYNIPEINKIIFNILKEHKTKKGISYYDVFKFKISGLTFAQIGKKYNKQKQAIHFVYCKSLKILKENEKIKNLFQ